MNFAHKLFAKIFNFFELFSFNKIFITFIISEISSNSGLEYLKRELNKKKQFEYCYIYKDKYSFDDLDSPKEKFLKLFNLLDFFFIKTFILSKSKYVFLEDNFFPMAYMKFDDNSTVIQLWHASGAFKRFGFDVVDDEKVKKLIELSSSKIDYLVVSSDKVSKIYKEAFQIENNKILPFGTPKTDYYFDKKNNNEKNIMKIRSKFEKEYPEIKGKKIVLYAPTFRENEKKNNDILLHFDKQLFYSNLKDDFCLFFKSHPKFKVSESGHFINVSNYENTPELLLISDILITDYSSIMIEYAILSKPIIFYPFDFDYYITNERSFYFDYNQVPGPIARNTQDIINLIRKNQFNLNKIKDFVWENYDYLDSNSSKRIVDYIVKEEK
ncbi:MAG: CDP-glycerol glycerophosphotransferase family protein [Methanobacteriaceae archaeon]|jgi:CDP-ribitol ribitolphosphotransferase|nr:CDP-glycerol glycerophosphotransferase family protein [Candidatus Methanorudis spinitermitis]